MPSPLPPAAFAPSVAAMLTHMATARLGMWRFCVQGNTATFELNPEYAELIGWAGAEETTLAREFFLQWVHPQDQHAVLAAFFDNLPAGGEPFSLELRILNRTTGAWQPVVLDGTAQPAQRQEEAGATLFVGCIQDKPVDESEERARIMLNSSPMASTFWSAEGRVIDCNDAVVRLFGLHHKEEYRDNFMSFSPERQPDGRVSRELAKEYVHEAFTKGHKRFEWVHVKKDGTPVPSEVTLVRVAWHHGPIVVGYTQDLTEIRQIQQERDNERRLLKAIMDSSPVCFVVILENTIHFANPFAMEFMGIHLGDSIEDVYVDKAQRALFLEELQRQGTLSWRVISIQAANGRNKEMLVNAFLADYHGEQCTMAWLLDVTEMREQERKLRHARDAAQQSSLAKNAFLANMSHEIRTPMNAILGMIHLVLGTSLTAHQRDYLEKAEDGAKGLVRLINDILDSSNLEAGKLFLEEHTFPVIDVIKDIAETYRPAAEAKHLTFEVRILPHTPGVVHGDAQRLTQAIGCLMDNAIKFTRQGFVRFSIEPVAITQQDTTLRFVVEDSGIGVPQQHMHKLFTLFSQADVSTTRLYGGAGLGLSIVHRLAELMHGSVTCHSEEGKGTRIVFTARFDTVDPEAFLTEQETRILAVEVAAPVAVEEAASLAGAHILLAEDNEINRIIAVEILESAGFLVDVVENGKQAVAKALHNNYNLIFMDIQMPVMDGLTATKQIRKHAHLRSLPIIAMTAHALASDKERSLKAGMNDHIAKPLDAEEVVQVIHKWLAPGATQRREPQFIGVQNQNMAEDDLPLFLPGVDMTAGLANTQDNRVLYRELLLALTEKIPTYKEEISNAVMTGEAGQLEAMLHSLRGEALHIGAAHLGNHVQAMLHTLREVNYPTLLSQLDALEPMLHKLGEALRDYFHPQGKKR